MGNLQSLTPTLTLKQRYKTTNVKKHCISRIAKKLFFNKIQARLLLRVLPPQRGLPGRQEGLRDDRVREALVRGRQEGLQGGSVPGEQVKKKRNFCRSCGCINIVFYRFFYIGDGPGGKQFSPYGWGSFNCTCKNWGKIRGQIQNIKSQF